MARKFKHWKQYHSVTKSLKKSHFTTLRQHSSSKRNIFSDFLKIYFVHFWRENSNFKHWKQYHSVTKSLKKSHFTTMCAFIFKKKCIFGFSKNIFCSFLARKFKHCKQYHSASKSLKKSHFTTLRELLFKKKYILLILGAKIQTLPTISQCFKITKKSHLSTLRVKIF